jgi:hypothetical protein
MITRVAIEAHGTAESLACGFWGGCSLDPFEVFYHWVWAYGQSGRDFEALDYRGERDAREQLFEKELGKVEQLRKTLTEDVPSNCEHKQSSPTHALPQLVLEIEHSEVDSTEVVLGMHTSTDTQLGAATGFGYVAECEDPSLDENRKIRIRRFHVSVRKSNAPPRSHGGAERVKRKLHDLN